MQTKFWLESAAKRALWWRPRYRSDVA